MYQHTLFYISVTYTRGYYLLVCSWEWTVLTSLVPHPHQENIWTRRQSSNGNAHLLFVQWHINKPDYHTN